MNAPFLVVRIYWYYCVLCLWDTRRAVEISLTCGGSCIVLASDRDGVSWSWWLLTMGHDYNKTAWYLIRLLRYFTITDNNPSIHWPSVMQQIPLSSWCSPLHVASIALLSVLGEGSLTCGSLWGFCVLFTLLKVFCFFFLVLVVV